MQSQRLRDSVDKSEIRYAGRHDMAQVEADKVPIPNNGLVAYTGDVDKDQEDECDEEEEGCDQRPYFACASCALDLFFAEFRDDSRWGRLRDGGVVRLAAAREDAHDKRLGDFQALKGRRSKACCSGGL